MRPRTAADYARQANERGFRRIVNVNLDDSAFDPVFAYAANTAPDRPVAEAIRDLLLQAVALDAANPALRTARMQAYGDARRRVNGTIAAALRQLAQELELEPVGDESVGIQPGNFLVREHA